MPTLILDRGGTCIGIVAPPCNNQGLAEMMREELRSLIDYGASDISAKRGEFEILELGIQMGPGAKVSCCV